MNSFVFTLYVGPHVDTPGIRWNFLWISKFHHYYSNGVEAASRRGCIHVSFRGGVRGEAHLLATILNISANI